jgi:hypothetical protein
MTNDILRTRVCRRYLLIQPSFLVWLTLPIHTKHTLTYLFTNYLNNKASSFYLLLLASVFNLSSGFMTELKGPLNNETTCTGDEIADLSSA